MEAQRAAVAAPASGRANGSPAAAAAGSSGRLAGQTVGVALGAWQAAELRLARRFAECRGLSTEQLEDIYQDTALALLQRSFHNEEHLRSALCWGIKHRALHMHRDRRRREEILTQHAPEIQLAAQRRQHAHAPEDAAILDGDRVIVSEFLTELDPLERRIFWLTAEGLRYRAIAPILGMSVNEARKAARSCEQKRERFQILYDSGRLCGYRAQTITAITQGQQVTAELAERAYTHLHACAACRAQHNTNAQRLKAAFQAHAAALAPIPLLTRRLPWITRAELRARNLAARLAPHTLQTPGGGMLRERAIGLLATGGAAGKIAAGAATIAVIAGGTIGATHAIGPQQPTPKHASTTRASTLAPARTPPTLPAAEPQPAASSHSQAATPPPTTTSGSGSTRQSGFAYLGTPSHGSASPPAQPEEQTATAASAAQQTGNEETSQEPQQQHKEAGSSEQQHGGGPFSP